MIYFDDAATSRYKPYCVRRTIKDTLRHSANPGRGSHRDAIRGAMTVEETREEIARFVCAAKANVIFTKNCTEALNLAILGTAKLGGHVITTALEHNSVLRPLTMLQKEGLISLTVLRPNEGKIRPEEVLAHIREKTYLVAITAMSNVTGYTPPLAEIGEICARRGIKLLVDGAQALGHTPLNFDAIGIDLLAGAGHKGLHGIMGSGFLVYGKHTFVNPLMYGGTGTESDRLTQPSDPPESLESGTIALPAIAALKEGIRWTAQHFDEINRRTKEISLYLHESAESEKLEVYSVAGSPLFTFRIRGYDSATVANILDKRYGIALRPGLHCAPLIHRFFGTEQEGLVRLSIGPHNTMREARTFLRTIRDLSTQTTE